jgi:NADH dehydrogenase (ubiquinone) Fe-S protein 6
MASRFQPLRALYRATAATATTTSIPIYRRALTTTAVLSAPTADSTVAPSPTAPTESTPTPDSATIRTPDGAVSPDSSLQAPNRAGVWAPSQRPRSQAMVGPRFEQTDYALQPQPWAAIELIHKQHVRWTHDRVVACDGGGGPEGHPRVYINTDKPEIAVCGYCGLPFANEHHRHHLEALPQTSYPLT